MVNDKKIPNSVGYFLPTELGKQTTNISALNNGFAKRHHR
jgi:hypothetical protein